MKHYSSKKIQSTYETLTNHLKEGSEATLSLEDYINLGDCFLRFNEKDSFDSTIKQGLKAYPENPYLLSLLVYQSIKEQDWDAVEEGLKKIPKESNEEDFVLTLHTVYFLLKNKLADALYSLSKIKGSDDVFVVHNVFRYTNHYDCLKAAVAWLLEAVDETIELDSETEYFYASFAESLLTEGFLESSAYLYYKLVDFNPYKVNYWGCLAEVEISLGNINECEEACDFALAIEPKYITAALFKAICCKLKKKEEELVKSALILKEFGLPLSTYSFIRIGMYHFSNKEYKKAFELLDKYLPEVIQLITDAGDEIINKYREEEEEDLELELDILLSSPESKLFDLKTETKDLKKVIFQSHLTLIVSLMEMNEEQKAIEYLSKNQSLLTPAAYYILNWVVYQNHAEKQKEFWKLALDEDIDTSFWCIVAASLLLTDKVQEGQELVEALELLDKNIFTDCALSCFYFLNEDNRFEQYHVNCSGVMNFSNLITLKKSNKLEESAETTKKLTSSFFKELVKIYHNEIY